MATDGYSPIAQQANPLATLLPALLGQSNSGSTSSTMQQLVNSLQQGTSAGTQSGTSGATTVNTAELGPLLQAFAASSGGMDPATMQQLITSIFTEGARAVPELTGQFANSTGSRVSGNSGLNLALGDLNRTMSTQAVNAILQNNQQQQATAANIAAQIAANTRATAQTGQTQQANTGSTSGTTATNTSGSQSGTTQSRQTVNPSMAGLLGVGGTALNFLDKKGVFDGLFGRSTTPTTAATGVGSISGGGSLVPNSAGAPISLTNGGGGSGLLASPASPSAGFLAAPTPAGSGFQLGGGSMIGASPVLGGAGGITSLGGFGTDTAGLLGSAAGSSFGVIPDSASNVFGTASTGSLGDNLSFGSNPYGYASDGSGITGAVGAPGAGSGLLGGLGDTLSNWGSGISDWASSFFADGGQIETGAGRVRNQNYLGPQQRREQSGVINYEGYAPQTSAAPVSGVGASVPAGSPSLAAAMAQQIAQQQQEQSIIFSGPTGQTPISTGVVPVYGGAYGNPAGTAPSANPINYTIQQMQAAIAQQNAMDLAAGANRMGAGGSGGIGEGAAPGQNEADNGAAGIGPSGIAAAPTGTSAAVGTAASMGLGVPGVSSALSFIAALAAAVNAANQGGVGTTGGAGMSSPDSAPAAVASPVGMSGLTGMDIGTLDNPSSGMAGGNPGADAAAASAAAAASSAADAGAPSGSSATSEGGANVANGGMISQGGRVAGPGTTTSDSIVAKPREAGGKNIHYSDGEYVIPADVVAALGTNHFDRMLEAFHRPA